LVKAIVAIGFLYTFDGLRVIFLIFNVLVPIKMGVDFYAMLRGIFSAVFFQIFADVLALFADECAQRFECFATV